MVRFATQPRALPVTIAVVVGALWRLWLMDNYAGWEESDYGNLAMIQGVVEAKFLHYDMNHMPGYYALAALVHLVVGDALIAGRAASFIGGVVALGLGTALAGRLGGVRAAWVAGLLLVVQPEFALYASSSLREPVAAAFVLAVLTALGRERMLWAGCAAAGAFFVRFDLALVMTPLLLAHGLGTGSKRTRVLQGLAPLFAAVGVWSLYCWIDHGTFAFWSHSVAVNVETGLGAEAEAPGAWWVNGAAVSSGLVVHVLPWRIGWLLWAGLIWSVWSGVRQGHGMLRSASIAAILMVGLWGGIGFVGQHELGHNLYWKWLMPLIPVVLPLGAVGAWSLAEKVGRVSGLPLAFAIVLLGGVQAFASNAQETQRQRERSEAWYRPQLELAQWIEAHVVEGTPMVLDNIPACWIRRREHGHRLTSWFDVPLPADDPPAFAEWIASEDVRWVMWFREEWTQAPVLAPFLAEGGTWSHGGVQLVERKREDGYGWIWFEVERNAAVR
jgi:hypothetical protein